MKYFEISTKAGGLRALNGSEEPDQLIADAQSRFLRLTDGSGTKTAMETREIAVRYPGGVSALLNPSKGEKGLSTPFARFNQMTSGLHPGELIIIAARPSMGKTALALNIAEYVASDRPGRTGQPVVLFSLEMPQQSLMQRLLCAAARVDSHRYRDGYLNQEERCRLSAALRPISSSRLFIDDQANTNVMEVGANLVAFIFREEVYKPDREALRGRAELIIAKQRNGPIGRIPLTFINKFMRFEDFAEREAE